MGSRTNANKKSTPFKGSAFLGEAKPKREKFVSLYDRQTSGKLLFQGINCSTGHFELKKIVDLECSCCAVCVECNVNCVLTNKRPGVLSFIFRT